MRSNAARPATWTTTLTIAGLILGLALIAERAPAKSMDDSDAAALQAAPAVPDAGSWTTKAVFPLAGVVRSFGVFFPDNGKFYVMGGRQSDTAGSDIQNPRIYTPSSDTWATSAATFSDLQVNNMVGGVLDFGGTRYIVVVGGSAAGNTTATAEVRQYNPLTDSMTTLTLDAWPGNVGGTNLPGGSAVYANKLYVFGGFSINVSMLDTIWRFDPAAAAGSRWTQMTAVLPAQRGYVPCATSGSYIYGAGGSLWDGSTLQDTTDSWRYDPTLDVMTVIATIPRATAETRAVRQLDGRIWVLGGGRVTPNPSTEVDIYDPGLNSWSLGPAMITARRNFPAEINAFGEIEAVGGYDTSGIVPLTVNEQFSAVIFHDGFESGGTTNWSVVVP